ncbi:hypothetical protein HAZT_HAZT007218 [Hyalella azteca]|uniref:Uncharacterized protein n=1 Tax=Hyalella azteca TaxID=294128 RepID=A0A6A0H6U3_HYAAZ|nr:hypothetical protein HAZT_HAZT007218 [Hyalella azteca]
MSEIFPTMGKCSFRMYGPSGTIEKRDIMCLLPTNIANEKLRAFNFPRHNMKSFEPLLGNLATRQDVEIVLNDSDFGDYILLSQLADNMDLAMFSEFVRYLAKHIREERRTSSNDSGVHDDDDISKLKRKEAEIHEHPYLSAKA